MLSPGTEALMDLWGTDDAPSSPPVYQEAKPEFIPAPMPVIKKRKKQVKVPESKKDAKYHAYRKKNTARAKAIRDRKREEKRLSALRLKKALVRNEDLRKEVLRLEEARYTFM